MSAEGPVPPTTTDLTVVFHDRSGTLDRVFGVVRRQGCAVVGVQLGPSEQPAVARMTLTLAGGNPARLAQQLGRLVDVIAAHDATNKPDARRRASVPATPPYHFQADGMSAHDGDDPSKIEPRED